MFAPPTLSIPFVFGWWVSLTLIHLILTRFQPGERAGFRISFNRFNGFSNHRQCKPLKRLPGDLRLLLITRLKPGDNESANIQTDPLAVFGNLSVALT